MKRYVVLMISVLTIFFTYHYDVYATDSVYSINKYSDEILEYIIDSYNEEQYKDGLIVAGTYLNEIDERKETQINDIQVIVAKYDYRGNLLWTYDYGKEIEDKIYDISYSYNSKNMIDGYLLLVNKTCNLEDIEINKNIFIELSLDGEYIREIELDFPNDKINKMILSYDESNNLDGYILIGTNDSNTFIAKYNLDLEKVFVKQYITSDYLTSIEEIAYINNDNFKGYIAIEKETNDSTTNYKLVKYDLTGEYLSTIKSDFEEKDIPHILVTKDSYIVYGYTNEVKLTDNKTTSYYLIKYNQLDEEEWDIIGNVPVLDKRPLLLEEIITEDFQEYRLMYTNDIDQSIELVKISLEGIVGPKIKKLKNDYYDINTFKSKVNTIYFIGQINCPEDDNCDYDTNSLLLISNEDKVIEVKDNDSRIILIIIGSALILVVLFYIYRKKKRLN